MSEPLMKALYSEDGGAAKAFRCFSNGCKKVTRTERGIWMHLKRVHGIEKQAEFKFAIIAESKSAEELPF